MAKAFQTNAFQSNYPGRFGAFQGFDRIPTFTADGSLNTTTVRDFLDIAMGPIMLDQKRTTAVVIEAFIYDPSTKPPLPFDPTTVQLNLIRPDDTLELTLQAMSQISTGFYRYIWQSDANDQLGAYRINVKATSGGNVAQTIDQVGFRLV